MNKKFSCPICGYVHEGETAPEICPQCKQKIQWNIIEEGAALSFVTEHVIGIAKGTRKVKLNSSCNEAIDSGFSSE